MLIQRVISALVAVAAILVVLFLLPAWVTQPVIGLFVAAAAWEWASLARFVSVPARAAYAALIMLLCAAYAVFADAQVFTAVLLAAGFWWLVALVLVLVYPIRVPRWLALLAGPLALLPLFMALASLAEYSSANIDGAVLLLFVLVTIWGTDVGGYFAGRSFGKRKLAPNVSPKKTWAGVIGGLLIASACGFVGSQIFGLAWYRLVPLCVATAAVSILGDLTVSLFKREAGLKDSGTLFPGHGGMLDRLDSISAGAPLFVAGIAIGHGPW